MDEFQRDSRQKARPAAKGGGEEDLDAIDQAAADSFPASDAPATSGPAADGGPPTSTGGHTAPAGASGLGRFLADVDYPTDKDTLLEAARQRGADQEAIGLVRSVPQERFNSLDEVLQAVGERG